MLLSFPCVDDDGREYGGEVTFKFKDMSAVKRMSKWEYIREEPDGPRLETQKIIPDCCTIFIGREEFDIKADYDQLIAKFKEHNEMYP